MTIPTNTTVHKDINKSYFGGRVEVFNSGLGINKIYHFDVPGLYAGIIQKPLPYGNPVYVNALPDSKTSANFINELNKNNLIGFFKCVVDCKRTINIPVLPVKHNGKLIFPQGRFVGTWTTIELLKALELGNTVTIKRGWVFKIGKPLAKYANKITQLKDQARLEGNTTLRTVIKLITNSLYGKFASKYYISTTAIVDDNNFSEIIRIFKINSVTQVTEVLKIVNYDITPDPNLIKDCRLPKDIINKAFRKAQGVVIDADLNIAIASAVTSYGRVALYELIQEITARGGKICYTDTDSIYAWLPEPPFGKPFGPYIWAEEEKSNTFSKALFIAPKIYWHQDINSKVTFKVKGVNTTISKIKYTFEELTKMFVDSIHITFNNQQQWTHINKSDGMGVIIRTDVWKSYAILTDSKRKWINVIETQATTEPLFINTEDQIATAYELPKLERVLIDNVISKATKIELFPTEDTKPIKNITQNTNIDTNSINILIYTEELYENTFSKVWRHMIRTTAYNEQKGNPITFIQIQLIDTDSKHTTTAFFFKNTDWIGYDNQTIKELIIHRIEASIEQYANIYTYDKINFRTTFKIIPNIVKYQEDIHILKLVEDIRTNFEQSKVLADVKQTITQLQEEAKRILKAKPNLEILVKQIMTEHNQAIDNMLADFNIKLSQINILKNIEGDEEKTREYTLTFLNILDTTNISQHIIKELQTRPKSINRFIVENIIKSLIYAFKTNLDLDFHSWLNNFCKAAKVNIHSESAMKIRAIVVYQSIITLVDRKDLKVINKTTPSKDQVTGIFTQKPFNYILNQEKWSIVTQKLQIADILRGITFTPKTLEYDPLSTDTTLSSQRKIKQINQINSTKVYLSESYLKFIKWILREILGKENKRLAINLFGEIDKTTLNALIIRIGQTRTLLRILEGLMQTIDQKHFHFLHFSDNRGRVYTKITHFSHISAKWLRPLFCLDSRDVGLINLKPLAEIAQPKDRTAYAELTKYIRLVEQEFNVDLKDCNNWNKVIEKLTWIQDINRPYFRRTSKINWSLQARIEEAKFLNNNGEKPKHIITTSPFQLDMKNNAIQHAATLVNNEEAIKATGVLEGGTLDIYTIIAERTLKKIKENIHNLEFQELSKHLIRNTEEEQNKIIKTLRAITKRPTIVIIYSATKSTIQNYVHTAIKEEGLKISWRRRQTLANVIIDQAFKALSKELGLMKYMQIIVISGNKIRWNLNPLSDFTPRDIYIKVTNVPIKINYKNHRIKTSINVMSNIANKRAIKQAIFVNIIHSLDALHLQLFISDIKDKNLLTIHDAILHPWKANRAEIITSITKTFIQIHQEHLVFKSVIDSLAQRLDSPKSYKRLMDTLKLTQPDLIKIDKIIS
jgi:hypothetical protein